MFSLENLSAAIPTYRHAGRFGLDLVALLWPLPENKSDESVWLIPVTVLAKPFDPQGLPAWKGSTQVSRAALRDHALVLRPRGYFLSTDKLSLSRLNVENSRWIIDVLLVRSENTNLEPAPRDLYIVLSFDPGENRPQNLTLHIEGIWRDFQGQESPISELLVSDLTIEFSE